MLTNDEVGYGACRCIAKFACVACGRMFFTGSRYGVFFGSVVQIGMTSRKPASGCATYAYAACQPRIELFLLHHEAQELFRSLRILRVLHDHLVEEQMRLGRHANGTDGLVRVLDVGAPFP